MIGQEEVGGAESQGEERRWGGGVTRERAEREVRGLEKPEKPQVIWDNIDGNRVV